MIKILNKQGIKRNCLNIITAIYEKPIANIVSNGGKTEKFSTKIRNKARMPTLNASIPHITDALARATEQEKNQKAYKLEKTKGEEDN